MGSEMASARSSCRSTRDVLIEEFEDVVFPLRDGLVQEVVAIVQALAHGRVDLHEMRLIEPLELLAQSAAWSCAVIVLGLDQHNRSRCLSDGSQQSLAQFGRTIPRSGGSTEGNRSANCPIPFGGEERELAAKRMSRDSDPVRINSGHSFQKRQRREHILEVIGGHQIELQVLARFFAPRSLFALQNILDEGSLAR